MRCPYCLQDDDKVIDTRSIDDASGIRRRRECLQCARRFTTFERVEDVRLTVVKRGGQREPFDRSKVVSGLSAALKNRPVIDATIESIVTEIEDELRNMGEECRSSDIGVLVLDRLHDLDEVGYLRFASVYKGFEEWADFEREASSRRPRSLDKQD